VLGRRHEGRTAATRRARLVFDVIEHGDDITRHFEGNRLPPIWFNKAQRPPAHAKLHHVLDEIEIVEELPEERAS
jgi:hypothetical protein